MTTNDAPEAGLCADCRFARVVRSSRSGRFYLCLRAADDPRFQKYPRLPVARCHGYEVASEVSDATRDD